MASYLCLACGLYCSLEEKRKGVCLDCGKNPNIPVVPPPEPVPARSDGT